MDQQPFDKIAKIVIRKLAIGRDIIYEAELWPDVRLDILLPPGRCPPPWTGFFRNLVDEHAAVFEFFSGRPSVEALLHVRAKGSLARSMLCTSDGKEKKAPFCTVITVTLGMPRKAFHQAYPRAVWKEIAPGHRCWEGPERHIHIDLLRLDVTMETAWLHVAGSGPRMEEALELLLSRGEKEEQQLLSRLREEVSLMPELHRAIPRPGDDSALRFLKAWERIAERHEGERKGMRKGMRKGELTLLAVILRQKFQVEEPALQTFLAALKKPETIEAAAERAILSESFADLEAWAKTLSGE